MYSQQHISETIAIAEALDVAALEGMAQELHDVRERGGRLFIIGSGGGAGHASHAVCDFRKIAGIETYTPTDNVSELTARVNDEGWDVSYVNWLKVSRFSAKDLLMVFSVGGGNLEKNISGNLVQCMELAKALGTPIIAVVGRDGGHAAKVSSACIVVKTVNDANVTPHTEAFQAVVWHLLVSHPLVKAAPTKWESATQQP
jgi:D-sedoheptulose 7-phosphate isomerase